MNNFSTQDFDLANKFFDEALSAEADGNNDKSLELLKKTIKTDPQFAEAYNSIGNIYIKKGDFESAIDYFKKASEIKEDVVEYLYDYGFILASTGNLVEAHKILNKCFSMEPTKNEIISKLGKVEVELGNHDKALQLLKQAIINDPADIVARFYLGIVYKKLNKIDNSKAEFNKVIEKFESLIIINPNNPESYYFLGLTHKFLGNHEAAANNLKRAIELDTPEIDYHYSDGLTYHDFDAFVQYAMVLKELGRKTEALENINSALEIKPGDKTAENLKKELV